MRAQNARPSFHDVDIFSIETPSYPWVTRLHHSSKALVPRLSPIVDNCLKKLKQNNEQIINVSY